MIIPLLFVGGGLATLLYALGRAAHAHGGPPQHEPDAAPEQDKTGYARIDAVLPQLRQAAEASKIPLGILAGWAARWSGGDFAQVGPRGERGLFQVPSDVLRRRRLDPRAVSTDLTASINAGLLLIAEEAAAVEPLGVAERGSPYAWSLAALRRGIGGDVLSVLVTAARAADQARAWGAFREHIRTLPGMRALHELREWFAFVDAIRAIGEPFGLGDDASVVLGAGAVFNDIPDPLDVIQPR